MTLISLSRCEARKVFERVPAFLFPVESFICGSAWDHAPERFNCQKPPELPLSVINPFNIKFFCWPRRHNVVIYNGRPNYRDVCEFPGRLLVLGIPELFPAVGTPHKKVVPMRSAGLRFARLIGLSAVLLITGSSSPKAANPASARPVANPADAQAVYRPEVRLRKLHLVRPDLIPYPIAYEIYC